MDLGTTFGPTNLPMQQQQSGQNRPLNPVQDAIRVLSFRVPSVVGANSPIPQGLLGGPTALGPQLNNLLTINWLRQLMGQGGQLPNGFRLPNEARTIAPGFGGPMQGTQPPAPPTLPGPLPINITPGGTGRRRAAAARLATADRRGAACRLAPG